MSDFDFSTVKTHVTKAADIPKITRTRIGAPNPLAGKFAQSDSKRDAENYGQWLSMRLPVKDAGDKAPYGTVAKEAFRLLTNAAKATAERGLEKMFETDDSDTSVVILHFRSRPRREKASSKTAE